MDNTDLRHHCYAMGYSDGEVGAFYDGYEQGRADGVREFAMWLSNTEYVTSRGHFILPLRGYFTVDDVVSEWKKEQK